MALSDWNDVDASREFLKKDYTGSVEAGSEFYQFCMDMGIEAYQRGLIQHLAPYEMSRYLEANNIMHGIHIPADSTVICPGYRHPTNMAAWRAKTQKSPNPKDSESKTEKASAKRKPTARPGSNPDITKSRPSKGQNIPKPMRSKSGITKSRPSKRQGISKPEKRTKMAERRFKSNDVPATTSRLRSLRPKRQRRRVQSG